MVVFLPESYSSIKLFFERVGCKVYYPRDEGETPQDGVKVFLVVEVDE